MLNKLQTKSSLFYVDCKWTKDLSPAIFQDIIVTPVTMKEKCKMVWKTDFPSQFPNLWVPFIKTILTAIVMMRCIMTYFYILSGLTVIWCIMKETCPRLMLPWLFVSAVKSICLTLLETLVGFAVCSSLGEFREACIEFLFAKAVEVAFATYLWMRVLSTHKEMKQIYEFGESNYMTEMALKKADLNRRRARSLIDETSMQNTTELNPFELKDVPQILIDMLKRDEDLSQDSLLGPGMMLASVSNLGSFDQLKYSQSLGELGMIDLKSLDILGFDDNQVLSPIDKALKFLKLNREDIYKARRRSSKDDFEDFYEINEDSWEKVKNKKVNLPKTRRKDHFYLKVLPDLDVDFSKPKGCAKLDHLDMIPCRKRSSKNIEEQEEQVAFTEMEEYDNKKWSLLMSNRHEDAVVDRYGSINFPKIKRTRNAYQTLYQQSFMSVIGPEFYEKSKRIQGYATDEEGKVKKANSTTEIRDKSHKKKRQKEKIISISTKVPNIPIRKKESLKIDDDFKCIRVQKGENYINSNLIDKSEKAVTPIYQMEPKKVNTHIVKNIEPEKLETPVKRIIKTSFTNEIKSNAKREIRITITNRKKKSLGSKETFQTSTRDSDPLSSYETSSKDSENVHEEVYYVTRMTTPSFKNFEKRDKKLWKSQVLEKLEDVKKLFKDTGGRSPKRREIAQRKINSEESTDADLPTKAVCPQSSRLFSEDLSDLKPLLLVGNQESGWTSWPVEEKKFQDSCTQYETISEEKLFSAHDFTPQIKYRRQDFCDQSSEMEPQRCTSESSFTTEYFRKDMMRNERYNQVDSRESSVNSTESDESFSLYYSKAADLASPLFDVRPFIYPDQIHYSFKNANKGFGLNITGGIPLIVRDSLTFASKAKKIPVTSDSPSRRKIENPKLSETRIARQKKPSRRSTKIQTKDVEIQCYSRDITRSWKRKEKFYHREVARVHSKKERQCFAKILHIKPKIEHMLEEVPSIENNEVTPTIHHEPRKRHRDNSEERLRYLIGKFEREIIRQKYHLRKKDREKSP